ncbi:MAG TPA: hypothetical protein PKC91_15450, partial [Ignavibacteria bacterium]|nr:hypothetical protein [Ignavibacteria bacterium]
MITAGLLLFGKQAVTQTRMDLEEVIKISLENNQSVKSSRLNIEKEKAIDLKSFNIPKPLIFVE